jgi:hypothetical protein
MRKTYLTISLAVCGFGAVSACLTNVPDPALGGVYACEVEEDCPGSLSCLQKVCEALELPHIEVLNPEEGKPYDFALGMDHVEFLTISATNFVLRPLSESNEAVPGEGHLVVFVDEEEVAMIDSGDLTGGVQMEITIPNVPGVHRIRVQARLNDGTNYDNEFATSRRIIWVNDGRKHIALSLPWPGDTYPLDEQLINAEVALFDPTNMVTIGPPMTGVQHVHVFYDEQFPECIDNPMCFVSYEGIVPSDDNDFGPVLLPSAGAGPVTLTAIIMLSDHTIYRDENSMPVFSSIEIQRTNQ